MVGTRTYNLSSDWGTTAVDSFDPKGAFIYTTSEADQTRLTWYQYPDFRRNWNHSFATGRPNALCLAPGNLVSFNRIPEDANVVTLDYWMTPEELTAAGDIPSCPEQFHDVIVWKALQSFAGSEGFPDLFAYAKSQYKPMYMNLCLDQLDVPGEVRAYPLARGDQSLSTSGFVATT